MKNAMDPMRPMRSGPPEAASSIPPDSQGRPLKNPIEGRYFDWPLGFEVGKPLKDYWQLEDHKPGETTFTHFANGTAHKNTMQGNDFLMSAMYKHGVACFSCHDVHGTANNADLVKPASVMCLECHGPNSPNGPRGGVEQHATTPLDRPAANTSPAICRSSSRPSPM